MARQWNKIWDQTAVNRGGAELANRRTFALPQQSAVINPNYYGNPNSLISQIAAHEKNMAITGRTFLESEAIKRYAGAQVKNMPPIVQQAIADQEYALASYGGGNGTPFTFQNPYTNQNLDRSEQDAVATAIKQAQQTSAPGMGVPASPKVAAQVTAFLSGLDTRTQAQNQAIEEQLRKTYGTQLDTLPAWRQYSQESKARFEETARRSSEELLSTDPNLPKSVIVIDPKTGQAGVDPQRYQVYQNAQKQQLNLNKQRTEAAKPLFEALQAAMAAQEDVTWYGGGSGEATKAMQNVRMQAQIADAATGGTFFSDSLRGTPEQALNTIMRGLNAPKPQEQAQPSPAAEAPGQSAGVPPQTMAGMADLAQAKLLPAGEEVILPNGRKVPARPTPFSSGQFSIPDESPKLRISSSATQVERNKFIFNATYGDKEYSLTPEIKAVLEANPEMAPQLLPSFEKKKPKPAPKPMGRSAQRFKKEKPKVAWQGKEYEVSEVVAAAVKKHPELTQKLLGVK